MTGEGPKEKDDQKGDQTGWSGGARVLHGWVWVSAAVPGQLLMCSVTAGASPELPPLP